MTDVVLPNQSVTGTNLWSQVEDNDQAIVDVVNGDLTNGNIAAGANISGSKLADGTVTEAKLHAEVLPSGLIFPYGGSAAPTGYLLCDGTAVSRTTYADLFAVCGTSYGSGDGSTTFNLPNLKGRVLVGLDSTQTEFDVRGESGGAKTHTLSTSEIPSHTHDGSGLSTNSTGAHTHTYTATTSYSQTNVVGGSNSAAIVYTTNTTSSSGSHSHSISGNTGSAGGGSAHNNLQPYLVVNYIIKA